MVSYTLLLVHLYQHCIILSDFRFFQAFTKRTTMKFANHLLLLAILLSCALPPANAQQNPQQVPLWENGAPGFENRKDEPVEAQDWWVKNVHNPSLTVFHPATGTANGAVVVVCPGGGHRTLVFTAEGIDAAKFLNSIGVTALVLQYRLAREDNSPYSIEEHLTQDAYRSMRMARKLAADWGLDPQRVGMMGFSAGGEVVALAAYGDGSGHTSLGDEIDQISARPDFQILVYPGPAGIPEQVPANAPPAFLISAIDDACCSGPTISILEKYHAAKLPAEAHIYAQGSHAFNMGQRATLTTLKTWPQRLADWMKDSGLLEKKP